MVFTVLMLVLLITPTVALVETLVGGSQQLAAQLSEGEIHIPSPPEQVAGWPIIGKPVSEFWALASENLTEAVSRFKPQLKQFSGWLLAAAARAGFAVLTFIVAIVIAGVLLANAAKGQHAAALIFARLAGEQGEEYRRLSRSTIRSVAQGVLGVALIQTILAGLGFLVAGIPAAGVLAVYVARHTIGKGNSVTSMRLADVVSGTGLCERTIRRCVAELADVVAVRHEPGKVPVWQFLIEPPTKMSATPDKNVRGPLQKCPGYIGKKDPLKDPSKNIRSSGDEQRLAEFAGWYQSYPRKVARRDAEKAYRQLTPKQRQVLASNTPAWVDEFSRRPID